MMSDELLIRRANICYEMLKCILANPPAFDDNCICSIENRGSDFLEVIDVVIDDKLNEIDLRHLVVDLGRFALEHFARTSVNFAASERILSWLSPVNKDLGEGELIEATRGPFLVWRQVYANNISQFTDQKENIKEFVSKLNADMERQEAALEITQELVTKALKDAHFIGLHKAFNDLSRKKRLSIRMLRITTWLLAILCMVAASLPVYVVWKYWPASVKDVNELFKLIGERSLATLTTIIPLLLLLVYWLRVKCLEYKSESGVLLQLEVRASVCQFIQGYGEWCMEQDPTKVQLDKFAAMIFSNVIPDPSAVPSAFDNVDQFANLIKTLKEPIKLKAGG